MTSPMAFKLVYDNLPFSKKLNKGTGDTHTVSTKKNHKTKNIC